MKALAVNVRVATGRVLCGTVFRADGKKLLSKGHVIREDDISILESEGMVKVWVTELEDEEIGEDEAVSVVAREMGCGCYEIRLAAGGRANLHATENCCLLVDDDLLRQINCITSVMIATSLNFSFALAGQRIVTVKSAPFAVAKDQLETIRSILRERGPIIQARPVRNPSIGVLYTDPHNGDRARQLFDTVTRQRLERFGVAPSFVLASMEDEPSVRHSLNELLRSKPAVILVASTTAPAGPEDVIGRAMTQVCGQLERFLAPVEPGNLLMLAYQGDVPIVSAPGCFRSATANVMDLVLPPLLARYRVNGWEVACLGHGGLLG